MWSLVALGGSMQAATPTIEAQTRAALYQTETRAELHRRGWHISSDEPGKLVADRPAVLGGSMGGYSPLGSSPPGPAMQARLTVSFQPRSPTHTHCAASIVGIIYAKPPPENPKKLSTVYVDLDSPGNVKDILSFIAKAEKRMIERHPEYGPPMISAPPSQHL